MTFGKLLGSLLLVAAVLAACGSAEEDADTIAPATTTPAATAGTTAPAVDPSTTTTPPATQPPDESPAEAVPVSDNLDPAGAVQGGTVARSFLDDTYPTELSDIVRRAIADLAARLSIDPASISVVLVEEVVWGDASLGCPQPGMSYTQVLTDGMRIVLEANGQLFDYRSGGMADPQLCVQALDKDATRAGILELNEDGQVVYVPKPGSGEGPIDGINPPDK